MRLLTWQYFALVAALPTAASCGKSPADPLPIDAGALDGTAPDAHTDTDGGPTCPAGSHVRQDGGCEATLSGWTMAPSLLRARDHHVTFAAETPAGAFLFAAVGTTSSGGLSDSVERAAINDDGSLSDFEALLDLPVALIGPGFVQVDRAWVLVGGLGVGSNSTGDTLIGQIEDDGSLTTHPGTTLAESRYHTATVALNGYVFALGGLQQQVTGAGVTQTVLDSIERASFDGVTLGLWETVGHLPGRRTHHAAVAHDGAIYVIGGGTSTGTTDILRAEVSEGGDLGVFTMVGQLPEARATGSVFVLAEHLYVLGGMTSLVSGEVASVLRAPLLEDGSIGTFDALPELPQRRAHVHQSPVLRGFVYSVGGSIHHEDQREVFVGRFE